MGALFASSDVANLGLTFLTTAVKDMCLLTSTPANLAACTEATFLARNTAITTAFFTLSSDTTTIGYKITMSSMSTLPVNATGNATVLCMFNTDSSEGTTGLHYYTKCSVNLASTLNSVTIQPWSITIADPTT